MSATDRHAPGRFCWIDLSSKKMSTIGAFYGEMFGWSSASQDTQGGPPYAQWELDGKVLGGLGELNEAMQSQGIPPTWNSYIAVDDIEATVGRAVELGASVTVPVMGVMDVGKLAFFLDPTGGHVALWQAGSHRGVEVSDRPGTLAWNELATNDLDRAAVFYGELFDWSFEMTPMNYLIGSLAGVPVAGMIQMDERWGGAPTHWAVYFAVDDVDAACARATEAGGSVCVPAFDTPSGRIAAINDPQGAMFAVIRPAQAGC